MSDVLAFMMFLLIFAMVGGVCYKYRGSLHRWLHDPKYGAGWYPDRKVLLQRKIEDAKAEMEWLDEKRETEAIKKTETEVDKRHYDYRKTETGG